MGCASTGTAPASRGALLDAYLAAGVESDHESTLLAEAEEKRRKGMWVFLRQGSASQNLVELAPTIVAHGTDQAAFCTDDREPDTLRRLGHVNDCARLAVASGISEIEAILLASTNPARYHGFDALGSLGPGHQADILAFSSLGSWRPDRVWQEAGPSSRAARSCPARSRRRPSPISCATRSTSARCPAPTLSCCPRRSALTCARSEWRATASPRCAPSSRSSPMPTLPTPPSSSATGRRGASGVATPPGSACSAGAIASTVAHDAHNVVVVGRSGEDMHSAVARLAEIGGGQVAVLDGAVLAEVPLPLAGLMSDGTAAEVADQIETLNRAAAERLGATVAEPFMQLSFIALSVIPQLRLTDGGLVDVDRFAYVPVQMD